MMRLFWAINLWVRFWWIINVRRITPADMHTKLIKAGYICEYKPMPDGYKRLYRNGDGSEIEITYKGVNGEEE